MLILLVRGLGMGANDGVAIPVKWPLMGVGQ